MPQKNRRFDLQTFAPYRLAVLADAVSRSMAQLYSDRFDLSRVEWRVLAALNDQPDLAAKDVVGKTTLDKMQVSRAVTRLERSGLITRQEDPDDRRNKVLRLTKKGETLMERIIPLVLAREEYLFEGISPEDMKTYADVSDRILHKSRELLQRG